MCQRKMSFSLVVPAGQADSSTSQEVGQIIWDRSPVFHCISSAGLLGYNFSIFRSEFVISLETEHEMGADNFIHPCISRNGRELTAVTQLETMTRMPSFYTHPVFLDEQQKQAAALRGARGSSVLQ